MRGSPQAEIFRNSEWEFMIQKVDSIPEASFCPVKLVKQYFLSGGWESDKYLFPESLTSRNITDILKLMCRYAGILLLF